MARFILDVASVYPEDIKAICKAVAERIGEDDIDYGMVTIKCIDETDNNQFHSEFENGETNELSKKQIENFKLVCNE